MKRKVFIVLFTMFSFQFFFSCIQEDDMCSDLPEVFDYENTYKGVSLQAFDALGSEVEEMDKNTFGILVTMDIASQAIAMVHKKEKSLNFGFSSAYACSPVLPEYFYEDPIVAMTISKIRKGNDEIIDVTDKFIVDNYTSEDNEELSLKDLFPIEDESYIFWYDSFNLLLNDSSDIPDAVTFLIDVELESGETFTSETALISFME